MIRTQISLVDRFTGPIMHMQRAMTSMINACQNMNTATNRAFDTSALARARAELHLTEISMNELRDSMQQTEQQQSRLTQNVSSGTNTMINGVKRLAAAYLTVQSAQKLISTSDNMAQTTARLNMMNDGAQTTAELQNEIYEMAQDTRASYSDTASLVSKLGINAASAFSGTQEVVDFAEQVNKNLVVSGAGAQQASAAMLQLTQALGSGVLRGDELNSIFENAPTIIQNIATYMGKDIGQIRNLAKEGEITADIVKNALLATAEETNKKFESMPLTWAQVWTMGCNQMQNAFKPVLEKINVLANDAEVMEFTTEFANAIGGLCGYAMDALGLIARVGHTAFSIWKEHGDTIAAVAKTVLVCYAAYKSFNLVSKIALGVSKAAAIVSGVRTLGIQGEIIALYEQTVATNGAATAQTRMNAAMLASPVTWIVIAILAIIWAIHQVVKAGNEYSDWHTSTLGVIAGAVATAVAVVYNLFLTLLDFVLGGLRGAVNPILAFVNFFGNVFNDPIGSIIHLFADLGDNALGVLQSIAKGIDNIFGSGFSAKIQNWRNELAAAYDYAAETYGNGSYKNVVDNISIDTSALGLERIQYNEAWAAGNDWGTKATEKITKMKDKFLGNDDTESSTADFAKSNNYLSDTAKSTSDTAKNTKDIKDSLDITSEQLKYIRDYAERKAVNRFTTAQIKVDMINHNSISSNQDLDGITSALASKLSKEMQAVAGGAY